MNKNELNKLKEIANTVRRDCIKIQKIINSGHLGGSLSAVEIMAYLYFYKMNIDNKEPLKKDRDVFVLSKGHASLGYYSVLARRGFFPVEELKTYRQINSRLQGHTEIDSVPGVECSTGSLGQGLSFGLGLALGYKKKNINNKVYVLLGDGEMQEGQIWEALLLQGRLQLDNLIPIIDNNRLQLDDYCENVVGDWKMKEKLKAFKFNVIEVDGNDFNDIDKGFNALKPDKANIIISNTVKGKGISFMENKIEWHSKKMNDEEYKLALQELDNQGGEKDD
ncbi:Transketolase, beta-subuit [Caldisalinibacter kiritimatiensis]|uniref:Transketolase, beta-subuit n=2 Tax=Caldisalinibacter kiritimatiensis TaxID=1304284 RepID=R1CCL3_9FIRM|nr:Transketolase, beta-subuit [Caldisalinibacter kiritimatiensis]